MPVKHIKVMEEWVDYYAFRDGYAYFSKNLRSVPNDETLYVYKSKEPCDTISDEIEIDGRLYQVKESDFDWTAF